MSCLKSRRNSLDHRRSIPQKGQQSIVIFKKHFLCMLEVDGFDLPTYIDGSGNELKDPHLLEVYGDEDQGKEDSNAFDIPPVTLKVSDPDQNTLYTLILGHFLKIGRSGHRTGVLNA